MPPSTTSTGIDPTVVNMAQAIRQQETGGATDAYTKPGASGEYGAYQFEPDTWNTLASKYGITTPLQQSTKAEQDAVAYNYLVDLKSQGFSPAQVAAAWNAGEAKAADGSWQTNVGTNSYGVKYDTPSYVANVVNYYQQFKNGGTGQAPADTTAANALPTYGATFAASPTDNGLTAGVKALGNIPSSVYGFGSGILSALLHPINTVENLGKAAIGGAEELTGSSPTADEDTQTFNALAQSLKQRYGSLQALQNTATNDPFGFGTDIASVLAGGAGLADRAAAAVGTDLGATDALESAGSRVAGVATSPVTKTVSKIGDIGSSLLGSANPDAIAAAARTGVNLPVSAYTDNAVVRSLDTIGNTGLGSTMANARVDAATARMEQVAQDVINSTGGVDDISEAGQNIANGLNKFESAYQKLNTANYQAINDAIGDVGGQTAKAAEVLQDIIAQKEAIADTTNLKFFKDKLAVLTGGKTDPEFVPLEGKIAKTEGKQYPAPTFDTIKRLKTSIGQMIDRKFDDPFVKSNIVDLKKLYGALSDSELDTLRATGRKDLVQQYLQTKRTYMQGRNEITSLFGKTIQRLANNGQYSKIVDSLIKPSTALEDIPRIMNIAGEQGVKDIRAAVVNKIFEGARNAEGDFTPQGINRQIKKYGEDRLSLILTPEQLQNVKDLGTVTKSLGSALAQSKGSQTAFLGRTLGEVGLVGASAMRIFSGDLIGGMHLLGIAVGTEGASLFIASNAGQNLLKLAVEHGANLAAGALSANVAGDATKTEAAGAAGGEAAAAEGTDASASEAPASKSLDDMYAEAPEAKTHIDALAHDVADQIGGTVAEAPLKGRKRAEEKVENDYDGNASRLTDIARNTIVAPDAESYADALSQLNSEDSVISIKEFREGEDPLGYTGALAKVKAPNGHVAEVQVNTPEMIYAKELPADAKRILGDDTYAELEKELGIEGGKGHHLYEEWRQLDPSSEKAKILAKESKMYYNSIREKAQDEV